MLLLHRGACPSPTHLAAVAISGNARFTVLTPQLIRMEYSDNGQFLDSATLAFLNRNLTVPQFSQVVSNGVLMCLHTSHG